MGVYTYLEKTLGLKLTPFVMKMKEQLEDGKVPKKKDWMNLLDIAARYETISQRFQSGEVVFADVDEDSNDEVNSQLHDMITELDNVYLSSVNSKRDYILNLHDSNYALVSRMDFHGLMQAIDESFLSVKELQKSFDDNGDKLRVVGVLDYLKRDYGLNATLMAHQDIAAVKMTLANKIREILLKEMEEKQAFLNQMNQ